MNVSLKNDCFTNKLASYHFNAVKKDHINLNKLFSIDFIILFQSVGSFVN